MGYKGKHHLILLCMRDKATPKELIALGNTKSTAYNYSRKADKELENYYVDRKRLHELRANKVKE